MVNLPLAQGAAEVRRMLEFFRRIADEWQGILHAYGTRFRLDAGEVEKPGSITPGGAIVMPPHGQG
ncbi:MAG: hypothetical protein ACI4RD_06570 [Kiritimatiellia bacterium]